MSEPSGKRKRLAPRGALVTIGIIVGTGLVLFSAFAFIPALRNATIQPIVDSYQERKARDLVKQARAHFEAQEWGEAIQAANEAYREAPEEPEAMRIMAEMCSTRRENLPRAIFFRNKIIAAGADTVEDHRGLAYAHLTLGNHRDADKALQVLLQKFPNDPGGLELLAKFQASRGDMEQATQTALRSLEAQS
ncbi:MAG: tetratricopeptide repeat protein [Verrucomicrobiales bacterium]